MLLFWLFSLFLLPFSLNLLLLSFVIVVVHGMWLVLVVVVRIVAFVVIVPVRRMRLDFVVIVRIDASVAIVVVRRMWLVLVDIVEDMDNMPDDVQD